jgi:hypothetical protein
MTATIPAEPPIPRAIDATKLAWWAEEAHGKQGTPLYIVLGADGTPELTDTLAGRQPLLEVQTKGARVAPLVRPRKLTMQVSERRVIDFLDDPALPGYDALFWTASAIEKFLFPYYHSQRLFSRAQMDKLEKEYSADDQLIAAAHRAPSRVRLFFANHDKEPEINFLDF